MNILRQKSIIRNRGVQSIMDFAQRMSRGISKTLQTRLDYPLLTTGAGHDGNITQGVFMQRTNVPLGMEFAVLMYMVSIYEEFGKAVSKTIQKNVLGDVHTYFSYARMNKSLLSSF